MRTIYKTTEVVGCFNGPQRSSTIPLALNPTKAGIAVGSKVENTSKGITGTVLNIGTGSVATDVLFDIGDFYVITLPTAQNLQTDDGPVIDVECKICGFSFPGTELIDDRCKICHDQV